MQAAVPPPETPLDDPSLYFNRELSWLQFNRRVLEEAQDASVPPLERLKFLAIFSSNLDEFFMVRVGGLQQKVQAGIERGSGADRMPPRVQLERISLTVRQCVDEQCRCLKDEVLPQLEQEGIVLRGLKDLTEADHRHLREVFRREIFPVLTPLAIDPGHPFPHLLNKSLNLAVLLERPRDNEKVYALVQVPAVLPRFVALPAEKGHVFTALETVIRLHLPELFPGMKIEHDTVFRVTRDSEYEIDDDEVEDLLKTIEEEIRKRRRGAAVRLEIEHGALADLEQFLINALDLYDSDVYRIPGILDLTGLFQIHGLPGYPQLRDPQFVPQLVQDFVLANDVWSAIRTRDILVHHPYESFSHVLDFIEAAASDDRVLAIKQTLYRTSSDSPIVRALQRAADNGKQVTAVIELKARLDEERNILWARELEKAGVHVVFGFVGLKTHCKVALVVRREEDGIRRYVHLASGNYNPTTARVYTDLGFFTCNPDFADDASALFNYLTGYGEIPQWRKLVVAPHRLQSFMIERIEQEIAHQQAGRGGRMIGKMNGLLEPAIVQALYRASQAGVRIDLNVRGICALRPGIPGISDNIRVVSIVDRFLEHSRIFYFGNAGEPQIYIGSADWMDRNLSRRVEVVFPIEQPELKNRLIGEILATTMADNVKARELLPEGSYRRVEAGQPRVRSQERFLEQALGVAQRNLNGVPAVDTEALLAPKRRQHKSQAK
ncbi:MAG: polyphosphate kinase 1 [Planctomycetia bacterium]|nr:polyphosphate kinase 1 [Planctomycetia bacterium]